MLHQIKKLVANAAAKPAGFSGKHSGTVLLVDDEAEMRMIGRIALEQVGYTVVEAPDGARAWEILNDPKNDISILVSDVLMPELDGFGLVRRLNSNESALPVLLLSGHVVEEDLWGEANQRVRYLSKPYHLTDLQNAVLDMIGPHSPVTA